MVGGRQLAVAPYALHPRRVASLTLPHLPRPLRRVALRLLVAQTTHREVRLLLTRCIQVRIRGGDKG